MKSGVENGRFFFDGVGDSALISLYLQKKLQIWVVLTCTIVAAKREKMFQKIKYKKGCTR